MATIIKKENVGPWILFAMITHAVLLIVGFAALIEFERFQLQQRLEKAREQVQQQMQQLRQPSR